MIGTLSQGIGPPKLKSLLKFHNISVPQGRIPYVIFTKYTVCTSFKDALPIKIWMDLLKGLRSYWDIKLRGTGRQTDRQKTLLCFLNPSSTKLGMVIEDLEHILPPRKLLGIRHKVSPLGSSENSWETRPHKFSAPPSGKMHKEIPDSQIDDSKVSTTPAVYPVSTGENLTEAAQVERIL